MRFLFLCWLLLHFVGITDGLLSIDAPIDKFLVDSIRQQFLETPEQTNWTVYFDTGGGSVMEGNRLLPFFLENNVTCIVDRAYSMGFFLLQACKYRYILPTGTLMQHDMFLFLADSLSRLKSYMDHIDHLHQYMVDLQTDRIQMTRGEFLQKIEHDWWMNATEALDTKCVDAIVPSLSSFL